MMLKRLFDIIAAACGLLLLSPVMVIVAWQVSRKLGSPVLFRQIRPGLHAKPFEMIKFRTMRDALDVAGSPLPDSDRITPFGSFLRSTSLDELPELWSVLKGDMSLVGPRPLLTRYLPYYTEAENVRFTVRPGITGWAQINGRNESRWDARLANDVWYVENQSLTLDIKIILKTVFKVVGSEGVLVDPSKAMLNLDEERNIGRKN